MKFDAGNGSLWLGDCLEMMKQIPSGSVDMVLCDLPYGTTACKWDEIIPFEPLWTQYWRIAKPNAAIVLTASQPFTTKLIASQIENFKYSWIWNKKQSGSFANAKYQPLRIYEDICIFGKQKLTYNPEMRKGKMRKRGGYSKISEIQPSLRKGFTNESDLYYPTNIIEIANARTGVFHPTQKPVDLFAYLIKTYTNPGELVLDNCAGSGTTAIAAQRTGRRWLCIEKDMGYFLGASGRIHAEVSQ